MSPTIIFNWAPKINIVSRGPGPSHLIFANQFKWAPNNNIVSGDPGPFNLMFPNKFKRITQAKLRVFILKVRNSGPHLTFLWTYCNNQGLI